MPLEALPCDLCGGEMFEIVYPSSIPDPDDHPEQYYASSRIKAGHLRVVRCKSCDLIMTNPRDDYATLVETYSNLRDVSYHAEDQNRRLTARAHLKAVEKYYPDKGALLDVGCATGAFVGAAHDAGWQVVGFDPSAWAIEQARKNYPNLTFMQGMLEELDLPPASFDAITLWDVLEHVRSPTETLTRLRQWLKPTGRLFLNIPNADSLTAKLMGSRWVLLLREHLWYFTPETIGKMLEKCGYQMVGTHMNRVNFSVGTICTRIAQYQTPVKPLAQSIAESEWSRHMTVRFAMGEMVVVAESGEAASGQSQHKP
jgi:2-polyprenyl-3-methyl-5-hydroxy-6-metoxy-1,4-benzoquinol methylase